MPQYTENHALLRFGGPAWAEQEIWSCGLRLRHIGGDSADPMLADAQASIEDVYDVLAAYWTRAETYSSAFCELRWAELNPISAATGKYLFPNTPVRFEGAMARSSYVNAIPQIAYCVTLRGLNNRGPASRGRWYVPPGFVAAQPLTATGVVQQSLCEGMANSAGTLLDDLQSISVGAGPNTWSPHLYGDGKTGPADSPVATIAVGNVLDTQRRRRNSLEETYFDATNWN